MRRTVAELLFETIQGLKCAGRLGGDPMRLKFELGEIAHILRQDLDCQQCDDLAMLAVEFFAKGA